MVRESIHGHRPNGDAPHSGRSLCGRIIFYLMSKILNIPQGVPVELLDWIQNRVLED